MEMVLKLMEVMDDDCDFGFPSIIPALLEERGRGAHPPCSSLASSIGGDRFPPLVHSVHGPRGRKPPPAFDLYYDFLSISATFLSRFTIS